MLTLHASWPFSGASFKNLKQLWHKLVLKRQNFGAKKRRRTEMSRLQETPQRFTVWNVNLNLFFSSFLEFYGSKLRALPISCSNFQNISIVTSSHPVLRSPMFYFSIGRSLARSPDSEVVGFGFMVLRAQWTFMCAWIQSYNPKTKSRGIERKNGRQSSPDLLFQP